MNEIIIDAPIGTAEGEVSSQYIRSELAKCDPSMPLRVRIHSEGGSVFEGFAIHDAFAAWPGRKVASIESSAFSIASYIPMAFDEIEITPNGYVMLHNPYMATEGDDEELASQAELLRSLKDSMVAAYAKRTGKTEDDIKAILKKETYLNAQAALELGLVTRIAGEPRACRKFEIANKMPHGVVAALCWAEPDGDHREEEKEQSMSNSQPVAATLKEIKAAFPKASSDFVIKCLEKDLPMASVATAAVEEMMMENEALKAQVAALQEELAKSKASVEVEVEPEEETMAGEDMMAKAKAGVKPVASASSSSHVSARIRWNTEIDSRIAKGMDKKKAAMAVNRAFPGLRKQMLDEVNS